MFPLIEINPTITHIVTKPSNHVDEFGSNFELDVIMEVDVCLKPEGIYADNYTNSYVAVEDKKIRNANRYAKHFELPKKIWQVG